MGVGVMLWRQGERGRELLVGLRKGRHGGGTWALPGGWLEHGEEFAICALRELREEAGIEPEQVVAARLSPAPPSNNILREEGKHSVTVFVEAELAAPEISPRVMEPEKCEYWHWCRPQDIPRPRFHPLEVLVQSLGGLPRD